MLAAVNGSRRQLAQQVAEAQAGKLRHQVELARPGVPQAAIGRRMPPSMSITYCDTRVWLTASCLVAPSRSRSGFDAHAFEVAASTEPRRVRHERLDHEGPARRQPSGDVVEAADLLLLDSSPKNVLKTT